MKSAAWQRVALYGCLVAALVAAYLAPPKADDVALAPRVEALSGGPQAGDVSTSAAEGAFTSKPASGVHLAQILPREDVAQVRGVWTVFGQAAMAPTQAVAPRAAMGSSPAPAPVPPPSGAASTLAAAPEAPPLPFRLLGQAQEEGQIRVFLQHGDQNLIVSTGDLIGRQYRVEHIDEQRVTFVYLPMNTVQHMALSPTSTETTK
jgi:hypothetical protein